MSNVNKKTRNQSYKYYKDKSILGTAIDEYALSRDEFFKLYSFYVTYSMCGNQSRKKRDFVDYGWPDNSLLSTDLGHELSNVLNLNRNPSFVFTINNDLRNQFSLQMLEDGELKNVDSERAVIAITHEKNNYLKLFYRIRNGLAHGKFRLAFSSNKEKMVIIQDDNGNSVTARIVIRLNTLLRFIEIIDKKTIIQSV